MRSVVQRVTRASVTVGGEVVGAIGPGLVALVGVTHGDTEAEARKLAERIWRLRVFDDEQGVMNLLRGRHDRRRPRRQPVHALRRHDPWAAPELDRCGPARAGRAPGAGRGRRASPARCRASPRAGSGPTWPWSWSTTGRSPCCSRSAPSAPAERSSAASTRRRRRASRRPAAAPASRRGARTASCPPAGRPSRTRTASSLIPVRSSTSPPGVTKALKPVGATWTTHRSVSSARSRDDATCWVCRIVPV